MREFQLLQQLHHSDTVPGQYKLWYPPIEAPNGLYREYDYSEETLRRAKEAIIEAWRRFQGIEPENFNVEVRATDGVRFIITTPATKADRAKIRFQQFKMAAAMAVFILVNPSCLEFKR